MDTSTIVLYLVPGIFMLTVCQYIIILPLAYHGNSEIFRIFSANDLKRFRRLYKAFFCTNTLITAVITLTTPQIAAESDNALVVLWTVIGLLPLVTIFLWTKMIKKIS